RFGEVEHPLVAGRLAHELGPLFVEEVVVGADAQPIQDGQAERQQRFADVEARERLAFEHEDPVPGSCEEPGRGGPGWARTDDDDVPRRVVHWNPPSTAMTCPVM